MFHCILTSVLPLSNVDSSFIWDKIFRSCFFGSVIQLAKITSHDVIVAMRCEFAVAEHQTIVRILNLFDFNMLPLRAFPLSDFSAGSHC